MINFSDERYLWNLKFDDYSYLAEQIDRVQLDLAVKILTYRAFGEFVPFSKIDSAILYHVGDQLGQKPSQVEAPIYVLRTDIRRREWQGKLADEDLRGITPLVYGHVNPYGRFDLNLRDRINLK